MGIWIRDQRGSDLCQSQYIWAYGENIYLSQDGSDILVGAYNSEAEAVKVLGMMHDHINNLAYVQFYSQGLDYVKPVFQMPEAGFSKEGQAYDEQPPASL